MANTTPYSETHAIEQVAPRLTDFVELLIKALRNKTSDIETMTTFLLNNSHHPIELPCSVQGVPIRIRFILKLDRWEFGPQAMISMKIGEQPHRNYMELPPHGRARLVGKLVRRIFDDVRAEEARWAIAQEEFRRMRQAEDRFRHLAQRLELAIDVESPLTLKRGNIRVRCVPNNPDQVVVFALVSQQDAFDIAERYGKR